MLIAPRKKKKDVLSKNKKRRVQAGNIKFLWGRSIDRHVEKGHFKNIPSFSLAYFNSTSCYPFCIRKKLFCLLEETLFIFIMSFMERFTDSVGQFFEKHPNSLQLTLTAVAASALTATSIISYQSSQRRSRAKSLKDELKEAEERPIIDLTPLGTVNQGFSHHTLPPAIFDDKLIQEQLSKNTALLGEEGTRKVRDSFVVVVGAGGVGSWAALMLMRSGVKRIRIIDFDQVTLSSLNRHAVATLEDVGTPKVRCIKNHFREIAPFVEVDACIDLLNADNVDQLLGGNPDYVVDAIDNINTKIDLIKYCYDKKLQVISSMGAGAKADPSRIQIADISETFGKKQVCYILIARNF